MARQAPVLRQAHACAQHAVPKECTSLKTSPYLTLSHIQCGDGAPSTQYALFNLFQCLVHDESYHLSIGLLVLGHRCKDMAMLPFLNIPFHSPWLTITSKQTALGCRCQQNVGMSRRNHHKHDPTAPFLCNRSTTASHYISDHKNHGQKTPGKRRSGGPPCLGKAVLAQGGAGYHQSNTPQASSTKLRDTLCLHVPTALPPSPQMPVGRCRGSDKGQRGCQTIWRRAGYC